jgi:hypothetical protein
MDLINDSRIEIVTGNFISLKSNLIRHDHYKLAEVIMDIVAEKVLAKDKKRIIDYYYVKDRIRKSARQV